MHHAKTSEAFASEVAFCHTAVQLTCMLYTPCCRQDPKGLFVLQLMVWCATHTRWTGPQQAPVEAQQQVQLPATP